MKRIILAITVLAFNTFLFSCNDETIAETDGLYNTQSTEGDDGNPPPTPPRG
ncbi:hypothetical protein [Zobellia alginiliquefaciens]|uniref:hypothetical protein n=1 Tax=Zobellia alginiliquefaciens TaxID=3032586 RepID=UPI0023E42E28|nr:hypothetical protein [Zobellia alginiliquefaciens]